MDEIMHIIEIGFQLLDDFDALFGLVLHLKDSIDFRDDACIVGSDE